jgi:hypothetical protein
MAETPEKYTDEIHTELGYLATWPPTNELTLGDIGLMEGRTLVRQQSITDLGLEFEIREDKQRRDRGVTSGAEIDVQAAASGGAPIHPGLKAGAAVKVEFKSANAIVMRAEDCRAQQFEVLDRLKREILKLHGQGKWKREWLVVSEVVHSARLLALISKSGGASVTLRVSAGIKASALSLAEGQGRVSLLNKSKGVVDESGSDATPLYRALKVEKRVFREPRTKQADQRGRARAGANEFDVVEFAF